MLGKSAATSVFVQTKNRLNWCLFACFNLKLPDVSDASCMYIYCIRICNLVGIV